MSVPETSIISLGIVVADAILITVHLLVFLALLRHKQGFRQERAIFLYHAAFFFLACIGATLASVILDHRLDLRALIIVASLHGLYSMTFLESWSLSEGSYSYSILALLIPRGKKRLDMEALKNIGGTKKDVRSSSLVKIGMLDREDDSLVITSRGRKTAIFFAFALWLINIKSNG